MIHLMPLILLEIGTVGIYSRNCRYVCLYNTNRGVNLRNNNVFVSIKWKVPVELVLNNAWKEVTNCT